MFTCIDKIETTTLNYSKLAIYPKKVAGVI